jgi:CRISPR-associated endonuclease/helicase Cas3
MRNQVSVAGLSLPLVDDHSYPAEMDPHPHQQELYQHLATDRDPGAFVNESPTGSGKTLSWVLPAADAGLDTLAVYPTNALIEDQHSHIQSLLDAYTGESSVDVLRVTSDRLDTLRSRYQVSSKGGALEQHLTESFQDPSTDATFLLTNPDTFVLMRRGYYSVPVKEWCRFELPVVDEFHRLGRKERNTLVYLLEEMYDQEGVELENVGFLSATPESELTTKLREHLSFPLTRIQSEGGRSFTPDEGLSDERAIMPPVSLELITAQTYRSADRISDDPVSFAEFCDNGRTVIMLDAVREVEQVYEMLSATRPRSQIDRIDGLHQSGINEKLARFDTLVSNSAVEVGVNFERIDQVALSAISPDAFLQRLGRLRNRVDLGRVKAFVPGTVKKELKELATNGWISRSELAEQVQLHYPDQTEIPETFDRWYSSTEAYVHLLNELEDEADSDAESAESRLVSDTQDRIERHFFDPYGLSFDETAQNRTHELKSVGERMQFYRDSSITAAVYVPEDDRVQTYRLTYLLRHGDVEFLPENEFIGRVPDHQTQNAYSALSNADAGGCIHRGSITGSEESGRLVFVKATSSIHDLLHQPAAARQPTLVDRIEFEAPAADDQPAVLGISEMKDALALQQLLCYPMPKRPQVVQRELGLPPTLRVLLVKSDQFGDASIAFGFDALYLHSYNQQYLDPV